MPAAQHPGDPDGGERTEEPDGILGQRRRAERHAPDEPPSLCGSVRRGGVGQEEAGESPLDGRDEQGLRSDIARRRRKTAPSRGGHPRRRIPTAAPEASPREGPCPPRRARPQGPGPGAPPTRWCRSDRTPPRSSSRGAAVCRSSGRRSAGASPTRRSSGARARSPRAAPRPGRRAARRRVPGAAGPAPAPPPAPPGSGRFSETSPPESTGQNLPRAPSFSRLLVGAVNRRGMRKKVQMRGGARRRHARRSLSPLSVPPRAPTKQMSLFPHPATSCCRWRRGLASPRGDRWSAGPRPCPSRGCAPASRRAARR